MIATSLISDLSVLGQPLSTPASRSLLPHPCPKLVARGCDDVTRPHPACDSGVSLRLGDQVSQQGAGAQKAQADVGGLCEVPQHRRVREVFGTRPTVDQRHHNLDETCIFQAKVLMTDETLQCDGPLYLSVLQRKNSWVFCGAQLVIVVHYATIGLFSEPLETLTLWVCIEKFTTFWTFAKVYFTFYWSILSIELS